MTDYMLDTDICIYAMSARYQQLDNRLRSARTDISISAIVVAELQFGAENSQRHDSNQRSLVTFLNGLRICDFDAAAAKHYGEIRAKLKREGTLVGGNDLLIGAHARSLGATLVTNNRREFDRIPGLKVENWAA